VSPHRISITNASHLSAQAAQQRQHLHAEQQRQEVARLLGTLTAEQRAQLAQLPQAQQQHFIQQLRQRHLAHQHAQQQAAAAAQEAAVQQQQQQRQQQAMHEGAAMAPLSQQQPRQQLGASSQWDVQQRVLAQLNPQQLAHLQAMPKVN
jgi:hypothetical protein